MPLKFEHTLKIKHNVKIRADTVGKIRAKFEQNLSKIRAKCDHFLDDKNLAELPDSACHMQDVREAHRTLFIKCD